MSFQEQRIPPTIFSSGGLFRAKHYREIPITFDMTVKFYNIYNLIHEARGSYS